MKNLRLIPDIHRQQDIVKADFAFDEELIALVKTQRGVRWSQTLKCWYFSKADFNLNTFYKNFEGNAFVDYSQLKQQSDLIKKTTIKLPKEYLEHLVFKRETGGFNTLNVTESTYWTTASKLANTYKKFTMDSTLAATNSNKYYAPDYLQNSSGVANIAMCCNFGNGDVSSGDGYKYRGRGLFQLTWKDNYTDFKTWYNNKYDPDIDPVSNPDIIASNDTLAVLSGLWYYKTRVVDKISITNSTSVSKVTKPINPKLKGLKDRKKKFQKAKDSINCK